MRLQASNEHGDDFIRAQVSVRASEDSREVTWKIPERLSRREDVMEIVFEEIAAELREGYQWPTNPRA